MLRTVIFAVIGIFAVIPVMAQQQQPYWYYCDSAKAYYPYVQTCPEVWRKVVPSQPPSQPQPSANAEPQPLAPPNAAASVSSNSNALSPDDWRSFVNKYPYQMYADPRVVAQFKNTLGKSYATFDESLQVQTPMKLVDDYLVGQGCAPHRCTMEESFFAVNATAGQLFSAVGRDGSAKVLSGQYMTLPQAVRSAYQEWAGGLSTATSVGELAQQIEASHKTADEASLRQTIADNLNDASLMAWDPDSQTASVEVVWHILGLFPQWELSGEMGRVLELCRAIHKAVPDVTAIVVTVKSPLAQTKDQYGNTLPVQLGRVVALKVPVVELDRFAPDFDFKVYGVYAANRFAIPGTLNPTMTNDWLGAYNDERRMGGFP